MHMQSYLFINVAYVLKYGHMHAFVLAHAHTHTQIYTFNIFRGNGSINAQMVLDESTEKKTHLILEQKKNILMTLK